MCWEMLSIPLLSGIVYEDFFLKYFVEFTVKSESQNRSVMSISLQPHGLHRPWNSLGQNTGVGSLSLLQGIFQTQKSNPGVPQFRLILYQLTYKGRPRILEWVAYPFSRGSSWPRNRTQVSCTAGTVFTNWAFREALELGFSFWESFYVKNSMALFKRFNWYWFSQVVYFFQWALICF